MIAGTGVALWQAHKATLERDRAVELAARGEAITKFMRLMLTETADADEPITVQTLLARTEEVTSGLLADDSDKEAAVLEMLGEYYLWFYRLEPAKQSFEKALALVSVKKDPEVIARLHCDIGGVYARLGDIATAQRHVGIGISMSNDYPGARINCLQERGGVEWRTGDIDSMLRDDKFALDILRTSGLVRPEVKVDLLAEIASAELELGHAAAAERDYTEALEQLTKLGLGERLSAMSIQNNWAAVGNYVGNPRDALAHLESAESIERKHTEAKQVHAVFAINHASVLRSLARYDEALTEYRLGLESATKEGDVPNIVGAKLGIALVLLKLGQSVEADRLLKEVNVLVGKGLPEGGFLAHKVSQVDGIFALAKHNYRDAITLFSRNIEFLSAKNEIALLAYPLILRSGAYLAENDIDAALSDAARAYETARSVQGSLPYSSYRGEAALLLAKIENKRNQPERAREWITIAFSQLQGSLGNDHPSTIEAKQLLDRLGSNH